jgi:hypothetical protein
MVLIPFEVCGAPIERFHQNVLSANSGHSVSARCLVYTIFIFISSAMVQRQRNHQVILLVRMIGVLYAQFELSNKT